MIKALEYIYQAKNQEKEVTWFRNGLYLFLLYRSLSYTLNFEALFSASRFVTDNAESMGVRNSLSFALSHYYSPALGALFIALIAFFSILGLLKKSDYFTDGLLWLIVINTNNFLWYCLTGGDYLLNNLLFFNIFLSFANSSGNSLSDLKVIVHNTALIALKFQICLGYALSAWFKIADDSWFQGYAVFQTFHVPEFSNKYLIGLPFWICAIANYSVLIYQALFPLLIWIRPLKIYLFAFGILQHLFIGLGMGILSFSFVMIICYALFLKYDNK